MKKSKSFYFQLDCRLNPQLLPRSRGKNFSLEFHDSAAQTEMTSMAKVYFYYAAMNAGKSTVLLQSSYNYRERGMRTLLFTPAIDTRYGSGRIESRIGLGSGAISLTATDNLFHHVRREHSAQPVACVLIDEVQFLTGEQVWQLSDVADHLDIPVLCYGLRTDFQGKLFPGSATLLGIADDISELKTICHCGRKATMNLRVDATGHAVREGAQVEIGGNDRYVAMCRRHFKSALAGERVAPTPAVAAGTPSFTTATASSPGDSSASQA